MSVVTTLIQSGVNIQTVVWLDFFRPAAHVNKPEWWAEIKAGSEGMK